jgi:hypothetical protein
VRRDLARDNFRNFLFGYPSAVPISLAQIGSLTAPTICASLRLSLSAARPLQAVNILPQAASERNRKRAKARPAAAADEGGHARHSFDPGLF